MNQASLPLRAVALAVSAIVACYVTTFIFFAGELAREGASIGAYFGLFLIAIFGVLFGFVGALLFLAPAFALAGHLPAGRWTFPLAGMVAGIAHGLTGWLVVGRDVVPGWAFWAGYLLIDLAGRESAAMLILVLAASCIGGLASGRTYGRILGLGRPWLDAEAP